jgi:hypothetical protein
MMIITTTYYYYYYYFLIAILIVNDQRAVGNWESFQLPLSTWIRAV